MRLNNSLSKYELFADSCKIDQIKIIQAIKQLSTSQNHRVYYLHKSIRLNVISILLTLRLLLNLINPSNTIRDFNAAIVKGIFSDLHGDSNNIFL